MPALVNPLVKDLESHIAYSRITKQRFFDFICLSNTVRYCFLCFILCDTVHKLLIAEKEIDAM